MSSCQDLLPGFLPSCVPGEQFLFCSLVCRFSAECTVFTAGNQILISILLCSPFALPPTSNPKTISAPLCGDGFWEKLFGLSSFTKTWKRYLFYLTSAFHPWQRGSDQTPTCKIPLTLPMQKSILFIYSLWLRAAAKKNNSTMNFYRLKTPLLLFSPTEKMCNLKLWVLMYLLMYFSLSRKHLQRWPELPLSAPK